ncbi:hypothetical protein AB1Y20_007456 [Prymnesium parvum]|uniref:Nuclear transcription factor Y subunit n=1 Tax=Prymnesium parvum TaxID=97485 RepID=A0AB34IXI5_PRYPA
MSSASRLADDTSPAARRAASRARQSATLAGGPARHAHAPTDAIYYDQPTTRRARARLLEAREARSRGPQRVKRREGCTET